MSNTNASPMPVRDQSPDITVLSISRHLGINTLLLSDGTELSLPHALFLKCPWRSGSVLSLEAFQKWVEKHEYASALERAGHSLSSRNRTEKELRKALIHAGYSENCAEKVIDRLRRAGYLDDSQYASAFARQRAALGYGENRIRQELRMKGIPEDDILAAFAELSEEMQTEIIRRAAEKAARGKDLTSYKDRQRIKAALARRGFDFDSIDAVLAELSDCSEDDMYTD